jgi:hypothetical protein
VLGRLLAIGESLPRPSASIGSGVDHVPEDRHGDDQQDRHQGSSEEPPQQPTVELGGTPRSDRDLLAGTSLLFERGGNVQGRALVAR